MLIRCLHASKTYYAFHQQRLGQCGLESKAIHWNEFCYVKRRNEYFIFLRTVASFSATDVMPRLSARVYYYFKYHDGLIFVFAVSSLFIHGLEEIIHAQCVPPANTFTPPHKSI